MGRGCRPSKNRWLSQLNCLRFRCEQRLGCLSELRGLEEEDVRAIDVIKTNSKARVGGGIIVTRDNGHLVNLIVSPTPPRQFLLGFFFNNFIFFMASIWRNIPDSSIECFLNFFDKLRECSDYAPPFRFDLAKITVPFVWRWILSVVWLSLHHSGSRFFLFFIPEPNVRKDRFYNLHNWYNDSLLNDLQRSNKAQLVYGLKIKKSKKNMGNVVRMQLYFICGNRRTQNQFPLTRYFFRCFGLFFRLLGLVTFSFPSQVWRTDFFRCS